MNRNGKLVLSAVMSLGLAGAAEAQQVTCRRPATQVRAIGLPGNHNITTRFQLDTPNLQTADVGDGHRERDGRDPPIADLSALTRITDNYVVYQVRVDGVPMEGQVGGGRACPTRWSPVMFDDEDEQFVDLFRILSYNFFRSGLAGTAPRRGHGGRGQRYRARPGAPGREPGPHHPLSVGQRGLTPAPGGWYVVSPDERRRVADAADLHGPSAARSLK